VSYKKQKIGLANHDYLRQLKPLKFIRSPKIQIKQVDPLEKNNLNEWNDLDLVLPSSAGTPIMRKRLRENFNKILEEAGLPRIRLHDLRHTVASLMFNHRIPVLIVSMRLGHSNRA